MQDNFVTVRELGKFGRVGNQLFQIAAVIGVARQHGIPAKFPKWFCNYEKVYFSDYFKNKLDESLNTSLIKHNFKEVSFEYCPIPKFNGSLNLHGYYQSEMYFAHCINDIKYYLEPKDSLIQKIKDKYNNILVGQTCSIHIRRCDYIGNKTHDVCNMDYYNKCINHMKVMGINKFFIFSDDISWCKENFKEDIFYFIEGNSTIEDLFTMSLCKHNIIANSSYSWWGSWLNKNSQKVIYAPSKWFTDCSAIKKYETIYRKDTIKV